MLKNPEKVKAGKARHYRRHRARLLAQAKAYYTTHREQQSAAGKRRWPLYYASQKEMILARAREGYRRNRKARIARTGLAMRQRIASDPKWKLRCRISSRISNALKRNQKVCRTELLLGCSFPSLRTYLQAQFRPGMSWDNYGPVWHVDHKKPCSRFDLSDPEQQRQCFHYTNLQPLFALENLQKGNRLCAI